MKINGDFAQLGTTPVSGRMQASVVVVVAVVVAVVVVVVVVVVV